jgi:hypothetical protein
MYTYKHLPTQKWIKLEQYSTCQEFEIYGASLFAELVTDIKDASVYIEACTLKEDVISSSFLNKKNYFNTHFNELELIII